MCRRALQLPRPGRITLLPHQLEEHGAPEVDLEAVYQQQESGATLKPPAILTLG